MSGMPTRGTRWMCLLMIWQGLAGVTFEADKPLGHLCGGGQKDPTHRISKPSVSGADGTVSRHTPLNFACTSATAAVALPACPFPFSSPRSSCNPAFPADPACDADTKSVPSFTFTSTSLPFLGSPGKRCNIANGMVRCCLQHGSRVRVPEAWIACVRAERPGLWGTVMHEIDGGQRRSCLPCLIIRKTK